MNDERGTVVWSDDPFKDDRDAGRPWLILGNETQPFRDEQYVAVALSTSGYDAAIPLDGEWIEGGPARRSYALPWAVHSPHRRYVEERIGTLLADVVRTVVEDLTSYVEAP